MLLLLLLRAAHLCGAAAGWEPSSNGGSSTSTSPRVHSSGCAARVSPTTRASSYAPLWVPACTARRAGPAQRAAGPGTAAGQQYRAACGCKQGRGIPWQAGSHSRQSATLCCCRAPCTRGTTERTLDSSEPVQQPAWVGLVNADKSAVARAASSSKAAERQAEAGVQPSSQRIHERCAACFSLGVPLPASVPLPARRQHPASRRSATRSPARSPSLPTCFCTSADFAVAYSEPSLALTAAK